jgi:hypothetical protein
MVESLSKLLTTPYGVAIFFAILWCVGCYFASFVAGWYSLSKRFRAQAEPYGEMKTAGPFFYTVYMRFWGHYSSVIRMTAAADALYVSVIFLFRIGHPPLRIPWNDIQFGRTTYFFFPYVVLTLGEQERIRMRISQRMARNLGILDRVPV